MQSVCALCIETSASHFSIRFFSCRLKKNFYFGFNKKKLVLFQIAGDFPRQSCWRFFNCWFLLLLIIFVVEFVFVQCTSFLIPSGRVLDQGFQAECLGCCSGSEKRKRFIETIHWFVIAPSRRWRHSK